MNQLKCLCRNYMNSFQEILLTNAIKNDILRDFLYIFKFSLPEVSYHTEIHLKDPHIWKTHICALWIRPRLHCNNPKGMSRYFSNLKRKMKQCSRTQLWVNFNRKLRVLRARSFQNPHNFQYGSVFTNNYCF